MARFSCVVELASKGLFSDHDTLVLKLVCDFSFVRDERWDSSVVVAQSGRQLD